MSVADKLDRLIKTKAAIKAAIEEKGVEVGDSTPFSEYPEKIKVIAGSDPAFAPRLILSDTQMSFTKQVGNSLLINPSKTINYTVTGTSGNCTVIMKNIVYHGYIFPTDEKILVDITPKDNLGTKGVIEVTVDSSLLKSAGNLAIIYFGIKEYTGTSVPLKIVVTS